MEPRLNAARNDQSRAAFRLIGYRTRLGETLVMTSLLDEVYFRFPVGCVTCTESDAPYPAADDR